MKKCIRNNIITQLLCIRSDWSVGMQYESDCIERRSFTIEENYAYNYCSSNLSLSASKIHLHDKNVHKM